MWSSCRASSSAPPPHHDCTRASRVVAPLLGAAVGLRASCAAGTRRVRRSVRRTTRLRPLRAETVKAAAPAAPTDVEAAAPSRARVAKRVSDLVISIADPLGEEDNTKLPDVGDSVQFSGGAVAHVIALADLCFAAALSNPTDLVEEGETYRILSKSMRPKIRVPKVGGALVDVRGDMIRDTEAGSSFENPDDEGAEQVPWFAAMIDLIRRQRIDAPLHAGVMGLDAFVPIGRGQSMLLRLPPGISQEQFGQFVGHIIKAQAGNTVKSFFAAPTVAEGRQLQESLKGSDALDRFTIVTGRSEVERPGEAVLAANAACALAEAHRDSGGDALLILDIEALYRAWSVLAEVSAFEGLAEEANKDQNAEIDKLTPELGVELWKYVAKKNANTARRRSFIGCFLQRAGRMAESRGGGSLTLLAFARLKDDNKLSRKELELKLKGLKQMSLDEQIRAKAIHKLQAQLNSLSELPWGGSIGVPDDFVEEAKATTDGHVVFADRSAGSDDGILRWCVDLQESVARGITSESVQNRPLHLMKSLNFKMYLMQKERGEEVIEGLNGAAALDKGPLFAFMEQTVGDVLSVEDESALLFLALDDAECAVNCRPLLLEALRVLSSARVSLGEDVAASRRRVTLVRGWAEERWRETPGTSLVELGSGALEALADLLDLRALERKRLLAAGAEPSKEPEKQSRMAEDPATRYAMLRARLGEIRDRHAAELKSLVKPGLSDDVLEERLEALRTIISKG